MWRNEDLFGVLGDGGYPLVGLARPDTMAEVGPIAKAQVDAGANRVQLPASPLMHGTGAFTTFQSLFLGASIVTLVGRTSTRTSCGRRCSANASRRWRSSATRSPSRCCARSKRPRATGTPYDISSLQIIISSGVMWSAEVKHGAHGAGELHLLTTRSGRAKAWGSRVRSARRASEHKTAKFSIGASTKVFNDQGVEVVPGSGETGRLAVGGHIPRRLLQGREQVGRDVPRHQRGALVGARRLRERRGRRHDHAARPRLGRHQLRRREDLPRRGRRGGEGASRGRRLPRRRRARRALRRSGRSRWSRCVRASRRRPTISPPR